MAGVNATSWLTEWDPNTNTTLVADIEHRCSTLSDAAVTQAVNVRPFQCCSCLVPFTTPTADWTGYSVLATSSTTIDDKHQPKGNQFDQAEPACSIALRFVQSMNAEMHKNLSTSVTEVSTRALHA